MVRTTEGLRGKDSHIWGNNMTTDPNGASSILAIILLYVWSLIEQLHPGAASGASFGCFFFLAFADPTKGSTVERLFRKVALLMFSWGLGYAVGSGLAASPNWGSFAMAAAVGISALSAAIFGALNLTIRNDGPLPRWLGGILDRIPTLKRGSDNE